jgi:Niemann-Pick C1 protein
VVGQYNTDLPEGTNGYNMTLFKILNDTYYKHKAEGFKFVSFKTDFLAERSIPDNIELEASQNAFIIVISYIMMFVYVSISIGYFPSVVHNRFILGFSGILVVLFSLMSAIGISFYMKFPLTMISAEVVPFLILAIGVDNMFLISRAERNVPAHVKEIELRIAYAMKEIGPSIFAAAFCEALAFFIGMLTDVPALYSFCLVAGLSVITDFFLQITFFLAALALDGKRI